MKGIGWQKVLALFKVNLTAQKFKKFKINGNVNMTLKIIIFNNPFDFKAYCYILKCERVTKVSNGGRIPGLHTQ